MNKNNIGLGHFFLKFLVAWMFSNKVSSQTAAFWDSLRTDSTSSQIISVPFSPSPCCVNDQLGRFLDSVANIKRKARHIEGFRILLYSGNDREKASKAKETAYRLIRNSDVYTNYQAPTFKVRLGDFYQKAEAFLAMGKLVTNFPNAVIIQEIVNIKP